MKRNAASCVGCGGLPDHRARPQGAGARAWEQFEADLGIVARGRQVQMDQGRARPDSHCPGRSQPRPSPALPAEIAASLGREGHAARRARVAQVLETLVATGAARTGEMDGETRYFVPR